MDCKRLAFFKFKNIVVCIQCIKYHYRFSENSLKSHVITRKIKEKINVGSIVAIYMLLPIHYGSPSKYYSIHKTIYFTRNNNLNSQ